MKVQSRVAEFCRRAIPLAMLVMLLLPAAVGLRAQATPVQQKQYTLAFLYPTWKPEEAEKGPVFQQHRQRTKEIFDSGKLILAGPRVDEAYGILVFEAGPEETQRIMQDDPGVKAGLFRLEVHALRIVFLRKTSFSVSP